MIPDQPASRGAPISPAHAGEHGDQCRQLHHAAGHDRTLPAARRTCDYLKPASNPSREPLQERLLRMFKSPDPCERQDATETGLRIQVNGEALRGLRRGSQCSRRGLPDMKIQAYFHGSGREPQAAGTHISSSSFGWYSAAPDRAVGSKTSGLRVTPNHHAKADPVSSQSGSPKRTSSTGTPHFMRNVLAHAGNGRVRRVAKTRPLLTCGSHKARVRNAVSLRDALLTDLG